MDNFSSVRSFHEVLLCSVQCNACTKEFSGQSGGQTACGQVSVGLYERCDPKVAAVVLGLSVESMAGCTCNGVCSDVKAPITTLM